MLILKKRHLAPTYDVSRVFILDSCFYYFSFHFFFYNISFILRKKEFAENNFKPN